MQFISILMVATIPIAATLDAKALVRRGPCLSKQNCDTAQNLPGSNRSPARSRPDVLPSSKRTSKFASKTEVNPAAKQGTASIATTGTSSTSRQNVQVPQTPDPQKLASAQKRVKNAHTTFRGIETDYLTQWREHKEKYPDRKGRLPGDERSQRAELLELGNQMVDAKRSHRNALNRAKEVAGDTALGHRLDVKALTAQRSYEAIAAKQNLRSGKLERDRGIAGEASSSHSDVDAYRKVYRDKRAAARDAWIEQGRDSDSSGDEIMRGKAY